MIEEFSAIMGISNFKNILLPPLEADPIVLVDKILGIPYKVGTV